MAPRFPAPNFKPLLRCTGLLKVGKTFQIADVLYNVHAVAGCARVITRLKTVTGGGNLELLFCGPDFDGDRVAALAPAYSTIATYGTVYTTGNPTVVAVVAGTEQAIVSEVYGEGLCIIKFTANVAGSIAYCDIGRI